MSNTPTLDLHEGSEQVHKLARAVTSGKGLSGEKTQVAYNFDAAKRFDGHIGFFNELDTSIEEAIACYSEAEESDLEELRHMWRELGMVRRTLLQMRAKYAKSTDNCAT